MSLAGKSKPTSPAALLPVEAGFVLLRKMVLPLLQELMLLYRENMGKNNSNFTETSKPNSTGEVSLGSSENSIVFGASKPGLDAWSSYI